MRLRHEILMLISACPAIAAVRAGRVRSCRGSEIAAERAAMGANDQQLKFVADQLYARYGEPLEVEPVLDAGSLDLLHCVGAEAKGAEVAAQALVSPHCRFRRIEVGTTNSRVGQKEQPTQIVRVTATGKGKAQEKENPGRSSLSGGSRRGLHQYDSLPPTCGQVSSSILIK